MTITPTQLPALLESMTAQVAAVVRGAEDHVRYCTIAVMVRGHVLIEGPPGTAKTLMTRTLARCLGVELKRVQCTPDLMPGDVLGANVFDFRSQSFHLTHGPVFTEFLLVDEINRTPPKTQSALLQAMQERAVSIDGTTHALPETFTVMATQNPIENEGTYPLPEAQLDRFLFKLDMSYPPRDQEVEAVLAHCDSASMPDLDSLGIRPVFDAASLRQLWAVPGQVRIEPDIAGYVVDLARATREHQAVDVGLSPRAGAMLAAAARATAACEGRDYVVPDDVKELLVPLGRHRLVLEPEAEMDEITSDRVLHEVLSSVEAPR
jgi:MoxR-like ATPase